MLFFGSRVGGMFAVPMALLLIARWGWRASFVIFGAAGLAWAAAWHAWYRDSPAAHPAVNAGELAWIEQDGPRDSVHRPTPWGALLGSRNLRAICAMYFGFGYGLYFYFTWLPTYLIGELGFTMLGGGFFASLPFLLAGLADLAGGWCTDALARSHGLRVARCWLGSASFLTCAALMFASTIVAAPVAKAVLLACALGSADFALSACWAVPLDIGAEYAGVITGFMNTFGNLGGLVGPLVVGLMVDRLGSWTLPLYVTAGVYFAGALAWLAIDPYRRVA
jgi:nitrate/nitrite transporter NarK